MIKKIFEIAPYVCCIALVFVSLEVSTLRSDLKKATAQAEQAKAEKEEAIAALASARRNAAASVQALEAVHKAEQSRAQTMNVLRGDINNAPKSNDGPLAPVLRRALDGLRPK